MKFVCAKKCKVYENTSLDRGTEKIPFGYRLVDVAIKDATNTEDTMAVITENNKFGCDKQHFVISETTELGTECSNSIFHCYQQHFCVW